VIDEEVERILRDEEERTRGLLTRYRAGLDAVARALLQHETLDGLEVERLVDDACGGTHVGGPRTITHADGSVEEVDEDGAPIAPVAD